MITVIGRTSGHSHWAALTNTRNRDTKPPTEAHLDALMWQMAGRITRRPDRDLF